MRLAADNCTLKERADLAGSSGEALVETFVSEHYAASAQSSDFIAPPYDEISWDRRRYLANRSCYSIVHVLLPEGKDGGHAFMRNARRLENGHYLVAHYGPGVVREYDAAGQQVREIDAPGGPHSAIRLPNGNTLIACGDRGKKPPQVFEVDPRGNTVWRVTSEDLPGICLAFMTGLQRLPNGNTVMTNWLGHGRLGTAPHVIEVTPQKQVVWTFADHQTMKTIATIQLLDVPGDVTRGEILH